MLTAYVDQLRLQQKPSATSVEAALTRNIKNGAPELWATPADQVTTEDLLRVVASVADAGKLRQAAKVRSYLRAAYSAGVRARQSAKSSPALRDLRITSNPARDLVTIEGASKARDRTLSVAELRAYWKRISTLPDSQGALLRFHLLTGAQRVVQLGRLTQEHYDVDLQSIQLRDFKGRRATPRLHDVPLIPEAVKALHAIAPLREGPYLFTVTAGVRGANYTVVKNRLAEVVDMMQEAGELEKGRFTLGDVRRTVETRLSAAKVSKEVRAQLQSHGLGGIQSRHYDRHEYFEEKREALETLYRIMSGASAEITPIKRSSAVAPRRSG